MIVVPLNSVINPMILNKVLYEKLISTRLCSSGKILSFLNPRTTSTQSKSVKFQMKIMTNDNAVGLPLTETASTAATVHINQAGKDIQALRVV